jgi:cytidylate kinase
MLTISIPELQAMYQSSKDTVYITLQKLKERKEEERQKYKNSYTLKITDTENCLPSTNVLRVIERNLKKEMT